MKSICDYISSGKSNTDIGRPLYTADISSQNALVVKVVRLPSMKLELKRVDVERAQGVKGIECILTKGEFKSLRKDDFAVIAGRDRESVKKAESMIYSEYRKLDSSVKSCSFLNYFEDGTDGEKVFVKSYSSEKSYSYSLETPRSYSYLDQHERLVVASPAGNQRWIQRELSKMLDVSIGKIRLIRPKASGGQYRGLDAEYYASLIALKTGKPSKLECSFEEAGHISRDRDAVTADITLSCSISGKISYLEIRARKRYEDWKEKGEKYEDFDISRLAKFYGIETYSGFKSEGLDIGSNEVVFALEMAINEVGEKLGIDPLAIRKKNRGVDELLDRVEMELLSIKSKESGTKEKGFARGVGFGLSIQDLEVKGEDSATATIKLIEDGSFTLLMDTSYCSMGTEHLLKKSCAIAIGVSEGDITIMLSDTDLTPFGAGTYSANTNYAMVGAVSLAGKEMRQKLLEKAGKYFDARVEEIRFDGKSLSCKRKEASISLSQLGRHLVNTVDQLYVCRSYSGKKPEDSYGAGVSAVEIDLDTGKLNILGFKGIFNVGEIIDRSLLKLQMEGGAGRGIERTIARGSREGERGIPISSADMPDIDISFLDTEKSSNGTIRECGLEIETVRASVQEAIYDAVGIRISEFPITSEQIFMELKRSNKIDLKFN